MYKFIFLLFSVAIFNTAIAQQQSPVKWSYTAKKLAGAKNDYEIKITALLPNKWHIYSQKTPDGGPEATKFTFAKNALVTNIGDLKEVGKLMKVHDENFGVDVLYYPTKVDFVKTVTVKANIKTNISGEVYYMVCDDSKCLPPTTVKFSMALK